MHFQHHGREVSALKALPAVEGKPLAILTASEDGRVKLLKHSLSTGRLPRSLLIAVHKSDNSRGTFSSCSDVGVAQDGASIKDLCTKRSDRLEGYLVVAVGAKSVIMTWLIKYG